MNKELKIDAKINDFYCPYHPFGKIKKYENSIFRKPNPGMILKAKYKHNINLSKSFMIGDQKSDEDCAKKAKVIFFYKKIIYLKI